GGAYSVRIVEVRKPEALTQLREAWRALQAQCSTATPYQTWEWNEAWWRHFRARKRLRLLLFYSRREGRETLVGIAPLYTSWHFGMPLRRLAWLGTGLSDYLGLLARPDAGDEVTAALKVYLQGGLRGWDIADLQQVRADSPLAKPCPTLQSHRSTTPESLLPMETCPYLPLPPTWEELLARLGKSMRSNLRYYERLIERTFPDARFSLADARTLESGMAALFQLHQRRWNARWLPGALGNPRVRAFHREVAARFLERGWLRLHLLTLDGTVRSALYGFAFGGRTYYYLGGFAPEYAKFSLGTLLIGRAIRHSIEEGCGEFDFLRGAEPYKYRWMPQERTNYRLLLLRSRERLGGLGELPGRAGFALNRVERFVVHRAKEFSAQRGRREKLSG
ncbi:MAG TPA: GNAT family N-acetyltransferase, partial [Chthonomonadaceae bacterium]|nr:GNAT family N-acetyltransferase [Chthonomonadaceae bacterium]